MARAGDLLARLLARQVKALYYRARESIGEPKRKLVVAQVQQACLSLSQTRDEFDNALGRFQLLSQANDGSLERRYQLLSQQYHLCRTKVETVSQRIDALARISEGLFAEWEAELGEYSSRSLKSSSKLQLKNARLRYGRLLKALRRAEAKMLPVLATFKDQVLHLKHHLNARAIAALQPEFVDIAVDIAQLLEVMEQTIAEANQFAAVLGDQATADQRYLPKR